MPASSPRPSISASSSPPGTGTSSTWCGCSCLPASMSGARGRDTLQAPSPAGTDDGAGLPRRDADFMLEHDLFRKPASTFRDHAFVGRDLFGVKCPRDDACQPTTVL